MVIYGNDFLEPIKKYLKFSVSNKLIFAMDNSNKKEIESKCVWHLVENQMEICTFKLTSLII